MPSTLFYPAAALSSLPLVKEWLHLYSPTIILGPLKATVTLLWPLVKMSLTPLLSLNEGLNPWSAAQGFASEARRTSVGERRADAISALSFRAHDAAISGNRVYTETALHSQSSAWLEECGCGCCFFFFSVKKSVWISGVKLKRERSE